MGGPVDLDALASRALAVQRRLDREAGRAVALARAGKAAAAEIERLEAAVDLHAKVAALLTSMGEERQEAARAMFEDLATRALQVIFGEELSFHLLPGEVGGQATLEPVIRSPYGDRVLETAVVDARGGGMVVVVGFVLRLVMVKLTPGARQVLFLDESFRFVSESFIDRLGAFLREVADRMGVQVFMITHDKSLVQFADVTVRLARGPDGRTQVFEGEAE